jgi:hypothetical protein
LRSFLSKSLPLLSSILLLLLLLLVAYADPLFLKRSFAGRDLLAYNLPMEKAVHDAYSRGRLPVWMPEVSGGRPLLSNPNAGALYPIRPLLSRLPFASAMRVFPVLHWFLGGVGMLLLLTSIGVSRAGAWLGALTYVFSGVGVSEIFYPNRQPGTALLPWVVWAVALPAGTPRRTVLLALLFGLDFLVGDVFAVAFALLAGLLWTLLAPPDVSRRRALTEFGIAGILGLLLAAPQIFATGLWIPQTSRGVTGLKLAEVFDFSLSPWRLLEFLIPFPFGTTWQLEKSGVWGISVFQDRASGLFGTLYTGAFALIAVVTQWKRDETGSRFARALFGVALAAAMLPGLAPRSWDSVVSPVALRYPEKFAVPLTLAFAIFAGRALDEWRSSRHRPTWPLLMGAALGLLAAVSALFPASSGRLALKMIGGTPDLATTAGLELAPALAEGGLMWMATLVALDLLGRGTRQGLAIALIILTAVPLAANRRIARTFREDEVFAPTAFARFLQRRDPPGAYRTLGESTYLPRSVMELEVAGSDVGLIDLPRRRWYEYVGALWHRGTVLNGDLDGGDLARVESLRGVSRIAARYRDSAPFFAGLALRWGIRFRDQPSLAGFRRIGGDPVQDWDELSEAVPDIRLVERWREVAGGIRAVSLLPHLLTGEIEIETGSEQTGTARPGQVRILEKTPERLRIETKSQDSTWLFVLRAYWPYRDVRVDGQEAEVFPAQLAYSAIFLRSGRHVVDWNERLPGAGASRWGPVLFVLGCGLLLVRRRSHDLRATAS